MELMSWTLHVPKLFYAYALKCADCLIHHFSRCGLQRCITKEPGVSRLFLPSRADVFIDPASPMLSVVARDMVVDGASTLSCPHCSFVSHSNATHWPSPILSQHVPCPQPNTLRHTVPGSHSANRAGTHASFPPNTPMRIF